MPLNAHDFSPSQTFQDDEYDLTACCNSDIGIARY